MQIQDNLGEDSSDVSRSLQSMGVASRRMVGLVLAATVIGTSAVSTAATPVTCAARKRQPIEVETLHMTFVRDRTPRRSGDQVTLRIRVTRAVRPGSPLSPVTEELPIAFASVEGELLRGDRALDIAANETDSDGWVALVFNLPGTTRPGPVTIEAEVRYAAVGSQTCEEPYVVETGAGRDDQVVVVRRT